MNPFFLRYRRLFIGLWEVIVIFMMLAAAFLLRFDFSVPRPEIAQLCRGLWIALAVKVAVFHWARLDRGWWRFAGIPDLMRVLIANVAGSAGFAALNYALNASTFPRSVYCIDFVLCFLATAGGRFCVRLYYETVVTYVSEGGRKGLLIYGAGKAGITLLREIRANPSPGYEVVGFLDDDPAKRHGSLLGVSVLGTGRDAAQIVDRLKRTARPVTEILIAIPSASGRKMKEALANCRAAGLPCKTIPGIGDLLAGKVLSSQIRNVAIGDLLGREPILLDEGRIRSHIIGRSVLITGAGGSIGSELCRQVAGFDPHTLVAFDQAESDLYQIDLELRQRHPTLNAAAELGDIRDYRRIEAVIQRYSVDSIFHAAAYKHVPMMEGHPLEAVKNNILGTRNLVRAADRNGVADFLMISSDKAVNPTNIMGATKRVAELIVGSMKHSKTKFVSVRFGNVLGSSGSVVPLFQKQIAAGGPVTVTHPEVRRYFMTVREAVQLVLQASTMGKGSEIFVLDMGEPIRIVDLARNMIRLSGHVPDEEVEIRFIGLRQGEKLHEELIIAGEDILPTYHEKIKIFQGPRADGERLEGAMVHLESLLERRDEMAVAAWLMKLVPEYQLTRPGAHANGMAHAASASASLVSVDPFR